MKLSFYDWCIENDHQNLLDMWVDEMNDNKPQDVSYRSTKTLCFHCGNINHPFIYKTAKTITDKLRTGLTTDRFCVGCHSIGQYIEDNFGKEYLNKRWSNINDKTPYEIALSSRDTVWFKCIDHDDHPDYDVRAYNIRNTFGCPYCSGRRVCYSNSLGFLYPKSLEIWSQKNSDTPYDYTPRSSKHAWFICPNGKHEDFYRTISLHTFVGFTCPICVKKSSGLRGEMHPNYKGTQSQNRLIRKSVEYRDWRKAVYQRDNYTCQCCGKINTKLNAHHIYDFSSYPSLRFFINNGITLCEECHDVTINGSLHSVFGTYNVSPIQLEEYINNKRKRLSINNIFRIDQFITENELYKEVS